MQVPRGAAKPHYQDAHAPIDQIDECVQQKVGEPVGRVLPALRVVQFRPRSPNATDHARDGGRNYGSRMGAGGITASVKNTKEVRYG